MAKEKEALGASNKRKQGRKPGTPTQKKSVEVLDSNILKDLRYQIYVFDGTNLRPLRDLVAHGSPV